MVREANGYRSKALFNLENGIDIIEELEPDLICLDIMMPQETGISFYQKIRGEKWSAGTPVMIISGATPDGEFDFSSYAPDQDIAPPDYYMEKPIDVDKFIEIVEKLISSKCRAKKDA